MHIVYPQVWRVKYSLAKIRKAARELLTLDEKVRNLWRVSFERSWQRPRARQAGSRRARWRTPLSTPERPLMAVSPHASISLFSFPPLSLSCLLSSLSRV